MGAHFLAKGRTRKEFGMHRKGDRIMRLPYLIIATALTFAPAIADAGGTEWRRYVIPTTGASIDMPISIFSRDGGPAESGAGRRFFTDDNRADLTVQSIPNPFLLPNSWPRSGRRPASFTNGLRLTFLWFPAFAMIGSGITVAIAATGS